MKKLFSFILLLFAFTISFSQELSVEKIWKEYAFYAKGVQGFKSMKDGEHYTKMDESGNIKKFQISNPDDEGSILIDVSSLKLKGQSISIDDYEFNSNETKILLISNTVNIYRRSFEAEHYLYDLETKKLSILDEKHSPQMLAEYSPDGTMVSYIFKNNLYIKNLSNEKILKVTEDGKRNKIINGSTDWVYEEEFSITKAYGWSADSKHIAYLKFNEKEVPKFNMEFYGELYPQQYKFKYPKAGEDNSIVTAHIYTLKNKKHNQINLGSYEYIPRLKWSSTSNKLIVQTMNRHQSELKYHLIEPVGKKFNSNVFYTENSTTYIDIDDNLHILNKTDQIIRTSEKSGYNHIYLLGFDGKEKQLTTGDWDVIEFYGIDDDEKTIYYSSAKFGAINKVISKIQLDGSNDQLISSKNGTHNANFTNGMKYFVHSFSNASTPPVYSLDDNKGKTLISLENNAALKDKLEKYALSKKEFFQIDANGVPLNAWLIKPTDFDSTKKYPVYVNVYGGPGSNKVSDSWGSFDFMFHQLLAQKGYFVFSVDPRGTMYRGEQFKKCTYKQLGKYEIEDVINACKKLQERPYIDENRFGIMGWSYGGYMASLGITKGADIFKMAIAVAPVTNWRYYDNIYTERFMQLPKENAAGYDENSPINHVEKIKGKYLLIHGSADDNVHMQNTMEMVDALVKANKQFDLFIYPNKNHGIYGGNTRNHLFTMIYDYILENL